MQQKESSAFLRQLMAVLISRETVCLFHNGNEISRIIINVLSGGFVLVLLLQSGIFCLLIFMLICLIRLCN